jgi:hypothetical protein
MRQEGASGPLDEDAVCPLFLTGPDSNSSRSRFSNQSEGAKYISLHSNPNLTSTGPPIFLVLLPL